MKTLITGGARSGKSRYAEGLLAEVADVDYLATSQFDRDDHEWVERIKLHQQRRPASWRTIETIKIADEISRETTVPLLIDCLAVWCSRVMDENDYWNQPAVAAPKLHSVVEQVVDALMRTSREVVMVTNEVGLGVVPETFSGRAFRDELGRLNAKVAQASDRLVLCVAGQPLCIKPAAPVEPAT